MRYNEKNRIASNRKLAQLRASNEANAEARKGYREWVAKNPPKGDGERGMIGGEFVADYS